MKKLLFLANMAAMVLSAAGLTSCKDEIEALGVPVIKFGSDILRVDLNTLEKPPVVCVVESETGLSKIESYIVSESEEGVQTKTLVGNPVTQFPLNNKHHSLNLDLSFEEGMVAIQVVATDRAGQVTSESLPVEVKPLVPLPEVAFVNEQGTLSDLLYVEGDAAPSISISASSEENLRYFVIFEEKNGQTQRLGDTIYVTDLGVKSHEFPLQIDGEPYIPTEGVTGLRVRVSAGEMNKSSEASMTLAVKSAITFTIHEEEAQFNGVAVGSPFTITGNVTAAKNNLSEQSYDLIARDRSPISQNNSFTIDGSGNFSLNIESGAVTVDLGYVVMRAKTVDGKSKEMTMPVHVGYKYYYLEAGLAADANTTAEAKCFFNSTDGVTYNYAEAMQNSKYVDVGFALWSNNKNIRLNELANNKFNSQKANAIKDMTPFTNVIDEPDREQRWEVVNDFPMGNISISADEFDAVTVDDFSGDFEEFTSTSQQNIANLKATSEADMIVNTMVYRRTIDGVSKNVIIIFDRAIDHNPGSGGSKSTRFMFKAKVEL